MKQHSGNPGRKRALPNRISRVRGSKIPLKGCFSDYTPLETLKSERWNLSPEYFPRFFRLGAVNGAGGGGKERQAITVVVQQPLRRVR